MSIERIKIFDTKFWENDNAVYSVSPEDKYFMLYLLTNPNTKPLGIYEFNKQIMAFESGYSVEEVSVLLDRFETKYGIILRSKTTNELAIKNYLEYSILKGSEPVGDCLVKEILAVKDKALIPFVFSCIRYDSLNETLKNLIDVYENGNLKYFNDTTNDNEEESERLLKKLRRGTEKKSRIKTFLLKTLMKRKIMHQHLKR